MRQRIIIGLLAAMGTGLGCTQEKSEKPTPSSESTAKEKTPPPAAKSDSAPKPAESAPAKAAAEPDYIRVQHILIGFKDARGFAGRPDAPPGALKRTKAEAEKLANDLFARAKKGEDFDKLVKDFTDDAAPGIYGMANNGKPPKVVGDVEYRPRSGPTGMVPAFGDTGFPLKVGEIGMAGYDSAKSPYGWHIIKRIE